jgi:hypothetical protein
MRVINVPSREFKRSDRRDIMMVRQIDFKRELPWGMGGWRAAAAWQVAPVSGRQQPGVLSPCMAALRLVVRR